ncbi:GNAT family N-acetyltransferase [Desulfobotulus sp. H1]|uniref:GNAT family N-acetyltransferase n=1 Tax=Desulfobotulus pelophilus TaxID=2823377 RepID=A0ABT3N757_9BACT|nr:GNAT family N-acetyltransferase [Desulfobotulus pelophilus]MCW7753001.1 GNAT family N-acetyltransferase [Desulfobotulus pelophilus]
METEIRILSEPEELEACIELQKTIWGLEDQGVTSPISLKAWTMEDVRTGLVMGAFVKKRMVGMAIAMATMEPGLAYGHMLGVREEFRDRSVGGLLHGALVQELLSRNIREMAWTYDPMESRNAYLYLTLHGGRGVRYMEDCYHVPCSMHAGMPMDRLLVRCLLGGQPEKRERMSAAWALARYPLASPEHMPHDDAVLLAIPGDLKAMKRSEMERLLHWQQDTRRVFTEYLNRRSYHATKFVSEMSDTGRRSFYLLSRSM